MKNIVRELRKNQKLTQEELAELIGISRQAINAIEKEKFELEQERLQKENEELKSRLAIVEQILHMHLPIIEK